MAICEFKLKLQSENGWIGFWPMWPWPFTSDLGFYVDITFVNSNKYCKFNDVMMTGQLSKKCDRRDRQTDGQRNRLWTTNRAARNMQCAASRRKLTVWLVFWLELHFPYWGETLMSFQTHHFLLTEMYYKWKTQFFAFVVLAANAKWQVNLITEPMYISGLI